MEESGGNSDNVSSDKIEEVLDGLDNFKKGDSSIFFLNYSNNNYYVTGSHQGRFKLDNNSVQLNKELKNNYKGIKKADFIKGIENTLTNK